MAAARKKREQESTNNPSSTFAKHANKDSASSRGGRLQDDGVVDSSNEDRPKGLTVVGKVALFLALPSFVGMFGLYVAYLETIKDPDRKMRIESDFAMPFFLTLLLVVVIGFQTQGFTRDKAEPIIKWPKVKKQRKIIHKHVVKGQDPNSIPDDVDDIGEGEDEPEKDSDAKKKD